MKAAVFCHNGLGDGINCLTLSQHLHLNGFSVDTYQNTIGSLQDWFPHLPVFPYPDDLEIEKILTSYDYYFVVWNDSSKFVLSLIEQGKKRFPDRLKVIYLYPSPNIKHEPYYLDCLTNPSVPVAENMRIVSKKVMGLPKLTHHSPLIPLNHLIKHRYSTRIVIHPTSGRSTRNWEKKNFLEVATVLQKRRYTVTFIPGSNAIDEWNDAKEMGFEVVDFKSLSDLASYLFESKYFIGNDSGPGHLASSVGISTVTICRRQALANLWAPSFSYCISVVPSSLIPNISGLRIRDQYWKKFISAKKVLKAFDQIVC